MNNLGTKRLETDRLILRKFVEDDYINMYNNWATDPETNKYLEWDLHKSPEDTLKLVQIWISEYDKGAYNWVVELKETHEIIGNISVVNNYLKDSFVEIGYCYGSKYWNKGYGTESLRRVIEFFLNEVDVHLVEAHHISGNPASGRIMTKAGMHKDAQLRDRKINKHTGEYNDLIIYSIIKDEL